MNKKTVHVVAGVIFDNKKLLACQRPADKEAAGFWEFPGGKVEPGETLEQALTRELREELSLQVMVLDEMYRLEIDRPEKVLVLHFLWAFKRAGSEPIACENQQFRWLVPEAINSVEWLPSDQEFVDFLIQTRKHI